MLALASSVRPKHHVRAASGRLQGTLFLVLLTGIICWGTCFVRSVVRFTSASRVTLNSNRINASETSVIASSFAAPTFEVDENPDDNSSETQTPRNDVNRVTTDLTVQSVLLSPTRRIAMICDHLVSEGQLVALQGHSFKVTAISESGVDLTIAESRFHLPLALSFGTESEMPQE
ncbi:hypothetical protein [Schlesneria paludicola]|uniref:hypothetical protein n=1 Tax=Schlesneria paludicola TaxID=360056 RepID=UPI00029A2A75|nr:hypothetical protein [Schlesneria paludicola]